MLVELDRIRDGARRRDDELRAARDFLVGVFPLRFETPGAVVGALAGLLVHDLPEDELTRYRPAIEAVTADEVQRSPRAHIRPERRRSCSSATPAVRLRAGGRGSGPITVIEDAQGSTRPGARGYRPLPAPRRRGPLS